jgi:DNA-binding MarR family transcriptional regulator
VTATEPTLSDADYQSLADFRHALRRFLSFSERAARDAGLTPAHHQLLLAIRGHRDGAPSTSDVAERLQIKLHSATELVERAEAKGLVTRRHTDPNDARRAVLGLTAEGEARLEALSVLHRAELRRFREELDEALGDLA